MCIHGWLILQSTHWGIKESIHFFPRHSGRMFWQIKMTWQLWTIYLGQWRSSDHESKIMRKIISTLSLDCNFLLVYSWNGSHYHLISLSYLYLPYSRNCLSFFSSFIYCNHPSALLHHFFQQAITFPNPVPKKDTEGPHPPLWVSNKLKTLEWA